MGEVDPESVDAIDADDPEEFLATLWTDWVEFDERHPEYLGEGEVGRDLHEIAPFGRAWPGLAPAGEPLGDQETTAKHRLSSRASSARRDPVGAIAPGRRVPVPA